MYTFAFFTVDLIFLHFKSIYCFCINNCTEDNCLLFSLLHSFAKSNPLIIKAGVKTSSTGGRYSPVSSQAEAVRDIR